MGMMEALTNFLSRREERDGEEASPVQGEEPTSTPQYGHFANGAVDRLHDRVVADEGERRLSRAERLEQTTDNVRSSLRGPGDTFGHHIEQRHLFGEKTASSIRKLDRGISSIESAETRHDRLQAKERFRNKVLPKLERKADKYLAQQVEKANDARERELRRLERHGASHHELERVEKRYEQKTRRIERDVDRRLGRPLRGLSRRVGGSSNWRPSR